MANLRLVPRNFIDAATVSADSELANLPATNTQNVSRSKPWRSATGTGTRVYKGTWGGDTRRVNCFFAFRHNLVGKTYRLRLFPASNWTGTPTYDSGAGGITIAPLGGSTLSYDWGESTASDQYDPLRADSPLAIYFTEASCQSFQLDLSGFSSEYAEIGRAYMGRYLETTYNPKPGASLLPEDNGENVRTRGGSLQSNEGEQWLTLTLDLDWILEAQRYVWVDVMRRVGRARDVVVSLFPGANDRAERDYTINGKFKSLDAINWTTNAYRSKRVVVEGC